MQKEVKRLVLQGEKKFMSNNKEVNDSEPHVRWKSFVEAKVLSLR